MALSAHRGNPVWDGLYPGGELVVEPRVFSSACGRAIPRSVGPGWCPSRHKHRFLWFLCSKRMLNVPSAPDNWPSCLCQPASPSMSERRWGRLWCDLGWWWASGLLTAASSLRSSWSTSRHRRSKRRAHPSTLDVSSREWTTAWSTGRGSFYIRKVYKIGYDVPCDWFVDEADCIFEFIESCVDNPEWKPLDQLMIKFLSFDHFIASPYRISYSHDLVKIAFLLLT